MKIHKLELQITSIVDDKTGKSLFNFVPFSRLMLPQTGSFICRLASLGGCYDRGNKDRPNARHGKPRDVLRTIADQVEEIFPDE